MPNDTRLEDVKTSLAEEQVTYRDVMEHGGSISVLHEAQRRLSQELQKVGTSRDLETILLAEELILENERAHYADTRAMRTSLDNALTEISSGDLFVGG